MIFYKTILKTFLDSGSIIEFKEPTMGVNELKEKIRIAESNGDMSESSRLKKLLQSMSVNG